MLELTQVKPLSGAPLKDKALGLHTNIGPSWKGLPGTKTIAYYKFF
jgi:hypothetical protein